MQNMFDMEELRIPVHHTGTILQIYDWVCQYPRFGGGGGGRGHYFLYTYTQIHFVYLL